MKLKTVHALPWALAVALLALPPGGAAHEAHRHAGPHEHGVAVLDVAVEGNEVHIELRTPAVNVVGFEHRPATPEQRRRVREALGRLQQGEGLFVFPAGAGCRLLSAQARTGLLDEDAPPGPEGWQAARPGHGDPAPAGGSEAGGTPRGPAPATYAHGQDAHAEEEHAEFEASYRYACERPGAVDGIDVRLFAAFPRTERARVQLVGPRGQRAVELTPKRSRLKL
jgi:hypothetical protein